MIFLTRRSDYNGSKTWPHLVKSLLTSAILGFGRTIGVCEQVAWILSLGCESHCSSRWAPSWCAQMASGSCCWEPRQEQPPPRSCWIVAPYSQPPLHWSLGALRRSSRQTPRQTPLVLWQRCHGYQTPGDSCRRQIQRGHVDDFLPDRVAVCIRGLDGLHLAHEALLIFVDLPGEVTTVCSPNLWPEKSFRFRMILRSAAR